MQEEGVTKFQAEHEVRALEARRYGDLCAELVAWRGILARLELVGQDPDRYGGAGYGNVSCRVGPFPGRTGARPFLISGTQTGGHPCMSLADHAVVSRYDIARNWVASAGLVRPSSESMTHGAIYDLGAQIRWVLHAHCPPLWRRARELRLPCTPEGVDYGTVEMAMSVKRLWRGTPLPEVRIFAMLGHDDGIVTFGRTASEAGEVLVTALARAYALDCLEAGQLCTT